MRPARNGCRWCLTVEAWPSAANFVLVRTPRARARASARRVFDFWCATLATRRGSRTAYALPWVPRRKNDEVLAAFPPLVKEEM